MKKTNFSISRILLTIFTPNIIFKKNNILKTMMESYSNEFDGDIISVPIPDDAPKEIPRIVLSDSAKTYRFEIAESRADFRIFSRVNHEIEFNLDKYLSFYYKLIDKYLKTTSANIGRIGIVLNNIMEKENPANFMVKYFINDRFLKDNNFQNLNEFQLNFSKKISLNGVNANHWIKCKNIEAIGKNKKSLDFILVVQDINTPAEELEQKNYSINEIKEFVKQVNDKNTTILEEIFF